MRDTCQSCNKHRFGSACAARRAHSAAGFRVRVYRCPDGVGYHVTASEKAGRYASEPEARKRRAPNSSGLAPVRTLAEVEALASLKRFGSPGCSAYTVVQGGEGLVRLTEGTRG